MKILVAYYSRTKITKKVAENMAKLSGADLEEIIDLRNRTGAMGYIMAGRDATLRKLTDIKEIKNNPGDYDLVVIGTPVWSFNVSTPIRTYLTQNAEKFKKLAFFCTQGGSGAERTFKEMQQICNLEPVAMLALLTKEVQKNEYQSRLEDFVRKLA
jgi:flavodoxin